MLVRKGSDIYEEFKTLIMGIGEIGLYLFHLMDSFQLSIWNSQCIGAPYSGND